jgi:dynein heavy chain
MVPDSWASKAYPSLKPLSSWVIDLVQRTEAIEAWYQRDPAKQGNPPIFWISGFYFPQAFLTGTLQNYARKMQISIDTISFAFHYIDTPWNEVDAPPEDGVYIYGMFLDGARWDAEAKMLAESHPKQLFADLPVVWLKPEVDRKGGARDGVYISPCYKTLKRAGVLSTTGHSTNYVMTMEIPTDKPGAHWIKRGLAAMLALNY